MWMLFFYRLLDTPFCRSCSPPAPLQSLSPLARWSKTMRNTESERILAKPTHCTLHMPFLVYFFCVCRTTTACTSRASQTLAWVIDFFHRNRKIKDYFQFQFMHSRYFSLKFFSMRKAQDKNCIYIYLFFSSRFRVWNWTEERRRKRLRFVFIFAAETENVCDDYHLFHLVWCS